MAVLPIHDYFSLNGVLTSCERFIASENEGGVYEVIRVIDGIPLFLEDHLARFFRSADIAGKQIKYREDKISEILNSLIKKNQVSEGNILLSCKTNLKAFFIPHVYPDEVMYREGVRCGLLHAEREQPNAKVFQTRVRAVANEMIVNEGFYEVLLIDRSGLITEGSRSNVFFIEGKNVFTPHSDQVLLGITRQKTIECIEKLGLKLVEESISLDRLQDFDSLFITGTSPKILPVKQVNSAKFDVENPILRDVMQSYDSMVSAYLESKEWYR